MKNEEMNAICPICCKSYYNCSHFAGEVIKYLESRRDEARSWAIRMKRERDEYKARWLDEEEKRISFETDAREWEAYSKRADEEIAQLKSQLAAANEEVERLRQVWRCKW